MIAPKSLPVSKALLLAVLCAACGPNDVEIPETGPSGLRLAQGWGARDILDRGSFTDGASIETRRTREVTRGTWELTSSNGSAQTPVPDRGGFPMGTILKGSGEEGKGFRNIKFPLPSDINAQQLTVRVFATEGKSLKMRALAVGGEGPVPGEVVDFEPNSKPTDILVPLPEVPGAAAAILEVGGDCASPAFLSFTLSETLAASTNRMIDFDLGASTARYFVLRSDGPHPAVSILLTTPTGAEVPQSARPQLTLVRTR